MVVKSYRGLLQDGDQERIRLGTNNGKTGYQIIKFQVMGNDPGLVTQESVVMVWKEEQSSVSGVVDFSNSDLLATGLVLLHDSSAYQFTTDVIFDNQVVNQDIFITHKDVDTGQPCNYYLELEVIHLSEMAAEYTILKDLRARGV
jgi:FlaG/FlaF family flagellin (archaellin)